MRENIENWCRHFLDEAHGVGVASAAPCPASLSHGTLIYSEGWMKVGMFDAAIYLADSKVAAQDKTQGGCGVFISADVDMGRALVFESPANQMTLPTDLSRGCDTIKVVGSPSRRTSASERTTPVNKNRISQQKE
jgi:hypothetical protein